MKITEKLRITGVLMEIRCDGQEDDKIDNEFTLVFLSPDGTQEITPSLQTAQEIRDAFDAIPEIDGKVCNG